MNIDPISSHRPTNADLAKGINQVHICFEDHKRSTSRDLKSMDRKIDRLNAALGLDGSKRRVAGLSSQRGAFFRTVAAVATSIGGIAVVWKVLAIAAPSLLLLFKVLNEAITTGKI